MEFVKKNIKDYFRKNKNINTYTYFFKDNFYISFRDGNRIIIQKGGADLPKKYNDYFVIVLSEYLEGGEIFGKYRMIDDIKQETLKNINSDKILGFYYKSEYFDSNYFNNRLKLELSKENFNISEIMKEYEFQPIYSDKGGFQNLGSTCYMNSAMQALYFTEDFRKEMIKQYFIYIDQKDVEEEPIDYRKVIKEIGHFFYDNYLRVQKSKEIDKFGLCGESYVHDNLSKLQPKYYEPMKLGHERDANEFIKVLFFVILQGKDFEVSKFGKIHKVDKLWENIYRIFCFTMNQSKYKPNQDIDLAKLENKVKETRIYSNIYFEIGIEKYVSLGQSDVSNIFLEDLSIINENKPDQAEMAKGRNYNLYNKFEAQFIRLPKYLIIKLKRYKLDKTLKKIEIKGNFIISNELNIPAKYIAKSGTNLIPDEYHDYKYILYAIISGSEFANHYVAYVKPTESSTWILFNDSIVSDTKKQIIDDSFYLNPKLYGTTFFYKISKNTKLKGCLL